MKLRIGDKVYLQRFDVGVILNKLNSSPSNIVDETFGSNKAFFITGSVADLWFDYVYEQPVNIEWLMAQDWILDYEKYAKMPLAELENLRERLKAIRHVGVVEFNAKDEDYRKTHFEEKGDEFSKLNNKITSLSHLIGFLKGEIDFVFPDGYQWEKSDSGSTS